MLFKETYLIGLELTFLCMYTSFTNNNHLVPNCLSVHISYLKLVTLNNHELIQIMRLGLKTKRGKIFTITRPLQPKASVLPMRYADPYFQYNCTMSQSSKDTKSKMLCSFYIEETQLGRELASSNYQLILQEESHTIDLLSIQIDKYEKYSFNPPANEASRGVYIPRLVPFAGGLEICHTNFTST